MGLGINVRIRAVLEKEGDCADMWKHFEDQRNGV